jgi:hypothetical protein
MAPPNTSFINKKGTTKWGPALTWSLVVNNLLVMVTHPLPCRNHTDEKYRGWPNWKQIEKKHNISICSLQVITAIDRAYLTIKLDKMGGVPWDRERCLFCNSEEELREDVSHVPLALALKCRQGGRGVAWRVETQVGKHCWSWTKGKAHIGRLESQARCNRRWEPYVSGGFRLITRVGKACCEVLEHCC